MSTTPTPTILNDTAGRTLQRLKRLRLACWLWLARPGAGLQISLHPRASEIRVRYREQTNDRPGPIRTATLQDLLYSGLPDFDIIRPHGSTNREHFLRTLSREVTAAGLLLKRIQATEPPVAYETILSVLTSLLRQHPNVTWNSLRAAINRRQRQTLRQRKQAINASRAVSTPNHRYCRNLASNLRTAQRQLICFNATAAEAQRNSRRLAACPLVVWNEAARPGLPSRKITPLDQLLQRVAAEAGFSRSIVSVALPEIGLAAYMQEAVALGVRLEDLLIALRDDLARRDRACLFTMEVYWAARTLNSRFARAFIREMGFPESLNDSTDEPASNPSSSTSEQETDASPYAVLARARGPPAQLRSGAVTPAPAASAAR